MAALASRTRSHRFATQRLRDARAQTASYTTCGDMNLLSQPERSRTSRQATRGGLDVAPNFAFSDCAPTISLLPFLKLAGLDPPILGNTVGA